MSNGNLSVSNGNSLGFLRSTTPITTGTYYWESTKTTVSGRATFGLANSLISVTSSVYSSDNGVAYDSISGSIFKNNLTVATAATYTLNDVIGILYNADARSISFYKNGVLQATITGSNVPTGNLFPANGEGSGVALLTFTSNFGQSAFAFPISSITSNNLAPSTPNLPFSAQDNGSNAATAYLMLKNANQAWTLTTASATPTQISDPNYPGTYAVTLTSLTLVGTIATATTIANTNFQVGSTVTVSGATPTAYNGTQIITGVTGSSSIANTPVAISITRVGTTATAVSTSLHGFSNGQSITISGAKLIPPPVLMG